MSDIKFTKREIIEVLSNSPVEDSIGSTVNYILNKLEVKVSNIESKQLDRLKVAVSTVRSRRNQKWETVKRIRSKFESKYADWLDSQFEIPDLTIIQQTFHDSGSQAKVGRPALQFSQLSQRTQRREAATISKQHQNDPQKILMACRHAARKSGEKDLAVVLKQLQEDDLPAAKLRKLLQEPKVTVTKLTPEQALSYLLDRSLSRDDYISMRLLVKGQGADIFPAYEHIRAAKEACRPPRELMSFTEKEAEVPLQALLNHTAKRIVDLQSEVIIQYLEGSETTVIEAVLICSWGFDGSSGHSSYKQQCENQSLPVNDENLFATTLIPLRLSTSSNVILWNNRTSQSARFCRPIKLEFVKESADIIKRQKQSIENEINRLESFEVTLKDHCAIRIHFSLFLTLIDGKVLNIITNTKSMQSCPMCHATPKQFNNLSNKQTEIFIPDPSSLQYGLSPLHAWIRFFECCLHISYRLDVKMWQMRSQQQKEAYAQRKSEVQKILWTKLGLKVDKPKAGGSGNSNDGNTARRAFKNPDLLSECLGLDSQMLQNFKIILIAMSCQLPIDPVPFDNLCLSTAEIYVKNYPWYPMPSTIHKVLIHGSDIIKNSLLPVGMLGEEASEARNKHYKKFRHDHGRKCNRSANMEDLFNRVMDTSDPIISTMSLDSRLQKRNHLPLPKEVQNLLVIHEESTQDSSELDDEIEEDLAGLMSTYESLDHAELSEEEAFLDKETSQ